ncbi:hypothetical protein ISS06_00640 [Patescibacteria group bacterium]|nr:hypothetical protein [Patescibacteria group bacterium]
MPRFLHILLISILGFLFFPLNVFALFEPNYIISDHDLTNYQAMDVGQIQAFLDKKGGGIANYYTNDVDGIKKSAATIIHRAGQEYKINPEFLITLLQREKSLITKQSPTQDDYNWATGFTCYDYQSPVSKYRGFALQVDRAAWRFNYYLDHPWQFRYKIGTKTTTLINWKDRPLVQEHGHIIYPSNMATAGLYNYAPHLFDNWLFKEIWDNWFVQEIAKETNGTIVRAENEAGVWLIQNNKKRPFRSKSVFLIGYDFKNVKIIDKEKLDSYEIGEPMGFPNYSLIQSPDKIIYMIVEDKKRPISEEIFKAIGFHPDEIIEVEFNDINLYKTGNTIKSPYPTGALLQDSKTNSVFYVKGDIKYPIIDITILKNNYPYSSLIKVDSDELNQYKMSSPIKFKDGSLIKIVNDPCVYLISNSKKMPIFSEEVFKTMGYQWESVINVSKPVSNIHELGDVLMITQ